MKAVQVRPPDQPDPSGGVAPDAARARPSVVLPTNDFVTCYQLHYGRLVRSLILTGADRSTAEEVAQEAFAGALHHWRRIKHGPNPPGYVFRAGFRLLGKAQLRAGRETLEDNAGERPVGSKTGSDPTGSAATSNAALEAVLAAMPPRRRQCAVMCLVVGLPPGEAATALGIADGTVGKHLDEARKELAAVLGPPE